MIRLLAKWAAKQYYILNQEFQASTADLHAGLSLRLAGEKRSLIETLNKEADDIEANIKSVDEKLTAGYWECENGHESETIPNGDVDALTQKCKCGAPAKVVSLATMTGQEKYESDKERGEAEKIAKSKREQAKAEEENLANSEKTARYFKGLADNNRKVAEKIKSL